MKKTLSLLLAICMAVSLLVPVSAAEDTKEYELIPYEGMDFSVALMNNISFMPTTLYYRELNDRIYSCCKLNNGEYALIDLITGNIVSKETTSNGKTYIPTDVALFDNKLNFLAYADAPKYDNYINDATMGDAIIDSNGNVIAEFEEKDIYQLFILSKDILLAHYNDQNKDCLKNTKSNQTFNITGNANVYAADTFAKYGTYIKKSDNKYYYVSPEGVISNFGISLGDAIIDIPLGENLWCVKKPLSGGAPEGGTSIYGAINTNGEIIIPFEYFEITPVADDIFFVWDSDESKYINSKNQVVSEPEYDNTKSSYYANGNQILDGHTLELLIDSTAENMNCYIVGDDNDLLIAEKDGNWYQVVFPDTSSQITGVTFSDVEYTYDGTEKTISVSGTLPEGATVTYKNEKATKAGTYDASATITADGYKTLVLKAKMKILPAQITVTADSFALATGAPLPELTYKVTNGTLAEGDSFSGKLSTRANTSKEGSYDILQGTLKLSSNYELTFVKGTITVSDKTVQNIVVSEITDKVYGDDSFVVTAAADETAKLSNFTYESSNTDVAEIVADGTVTIKGAGETEITVKEPGNDTYASFEKTQTLVVATKEIDIASIDLDSKTAVFVGVLDTDAEAVELDFDKLVLEKVETEPDTLEDQVTKITVKVTNFILKGDSATNYALTTEELEATVSEENVATVSVTAKNGAVTGEGTYLIGSEITLAAEAEKGYKFSGWYINDEPASSDVEYTFVLESDVNLVAKFTKNPSGGMQAGGDMSRPKEEEPEIKPEAKPEIPEVATPEGFADLAGYDWAKEAINTLSEAGIIKGTSASTFAPGKNITRADFAALIVRVFNLTSANEENFADVNTSDYFASELAIARNTGIVGGIGDNKFAPRGNITRQDMMVMLYRAMTKLNLELNTTTESTAADFNTVSDYAKEAVSTLMANGIINGKNGNVDPLAYATRAEVAVMLSRILDLIK